ncbi:uncharacterized protein LOC113155249 [Anabas testudineus]|uniref:uncharacterized protein LOC113155249 n=1 Tax=Anabas testudineus TaxID=64144 RepID=UPI000E45DE68|nr:uncharacterized protein LOC113155249 [Anabas testudineus]
MAGLTWILTVFCAAGCHLSSASPVLRSAHVVQVGQNASLTCNLTSSAEITWYQLRSDQLLPLMTVRLSRVTEHTVDIHTADTNRFTFGGDLNEGSVSLEILEVEEKDSGLYFCAGRCDGAVCVNRGIDLTVTGADGGSARDRMKQPCWTLGICLLPGLLTICFMFIAGFYLCSGKAAVCCCDPLRGDSALRVTEDVSLHYSSLRHEDKPRPPGREGPRLGEENVTYSTVTSRKNPNGSE